MTYMKVLLIGITVLSVSVLLLVINFGSPTTLGSIGRVVGGLMLLPAGILIFDGIAKGRSLYLVADVHKKDGTLLLNLSCNQFSQVIYCWLNKLAGGEIWQLRYCLSSWVWHLFRLRNTHGIYLKVSPVATPEVKL